MQQQFDFFLVIDFEATCVANAPTSANTYIQEIIEFPVVIIDTQKTAIVDTFQSYCRPIINPILSDYCKGLTQITQKQVNSAPNFADVIVSFERWLKDRPYLSVSKSRWIFITDGPSDFKKYLQMQCELTHIPYPKWACQWIDLKTVFSGFYGTRRSRIADMLQHLGLQIDGHLHSGIDDAKNIARIVIELIKNGCILMPTNFSSEFTLTQRRITSVSAMGTQFDKLICLNCGRCHSEDKRSCVEFSLVSLKNIPSLLNSSHQQQFQSNSPYK